MKQQKKTNKALKKRHIHELNRKDTRKFLRHEALKDKIRDKEPRRVKTT